MRDSDGAKIDKKLPRKICREGKKRADLVVPINIKGSERGTLRLKMGWRHPKNWWGGECPKAGDRKAYENNDVGANTKIRAGFWTKIHSRDMEGSRSSQALMTQHAVPKSVKYR